MIWTELLKNMRWLQWSLRKIIENVENELIRDVTDDLAKSEEYIGYDINAYAPEPIRMFWRV